MTPKILFTDIDGTLLDKNRELSINTIKQIGRLYSDYSIPVILVSARMPKSMRILQSQLGLSNEIICYNGALTLGKDDFTILQDKRIEKEISMNIFETAKLHDLHFGVFVEDNWMINKKDVWAEREIRNTKAMPEVYNELNLDKIVNLGLHKIMLMGDKNKIDLLENYLKENHLNQLSMYRSKDTYLEINPIKSNKWNAIKNILSIYNLSFADAIAIGDNYNDIEMIKFAGIGVAVENSPDEIKRVADFICPSNINDGVAYTIQKYFK